MGRKTCGLLAALLLFLLTAGCGLRRDPKQIPSIPRNTRRMQDFSYDEKGRPSYPGAVLGVDVSDHQGEIDWEKAAADGVRFAILRIGYRGYSEGGLSTDERFAENYVNAREAGLQLGVYFYSQAVSGEEAEEEADYVLKLLDGVPLELPVFFDWEEVSIGRTGGKAGSAVGDYALRFCRTITEGGYQAGAYFNQRYGYSIMHLEALTDYSFWIAEYDSYQSFGYQTDFWQFTGSGHVDGINVIVDMDLMYAPEVENEKTE
ncbi:MAG: glycoside hydrolase family 25 protein [Oscillospiraceae bacterium]|nr:glycoside hydrolase family 25 protein [Oscillospiraceae bacterium]